MQSKHKKPLEKGSSRLSLPMAADTLALMGTIACLNLAGFAVEGTEASDLKAVGVFEDGCDNKGGAAGAVRANVRRDRTYAFNNDATDAVTLADYGNQVFIADNNTISRTDNAGARSVAGILRDVEGDVAWIEFE